MNLYAISGQVNLQATYKNKKVFIWLNVSRRVMKAVIPAAGLGTRFIPASKVQPKEMLPVVDKPVIQYVVEEAVAAGIDDILIITGRGKRAIEDHFDKAFELEYMLNNKKNEALALKYLEELDHLTDIADIHYIRQKEPKGLGHAVYCAKRHIGNEPFAVLLGDDIIISEVPCTKQLLEVFERYDQSVIAAQMVPRENIRLYGAIAGETVEKNVYLITDLVEKPSPDKAPSNLAAIGRYILTPEIFDAIADTGKGLGGEVQLTDALNLLRETQKVYAYEFEGRRYDIGKKIAWIKATIELALQRPEFQDDLRAFLRTIVQ